MIYHEQFVVKNILQRAPSLKKREEK